jgi:hypothetical protein
MLEFTPYDEAGNSYLMAAASPKVKVGKKTGPPAAKTPMATCRLRVTMHFADVDAASDFAGGQNFYDDNVPKGRGGSETEDEYGRQKAALIAPPPSNFLPAPGTRRTWAMTGRPSSCWQTAPRSRTCQPSRRRGSWVLARRSR